MSPLRSFLQVTSILVLCLGLAGEAWPAPSSDLAGTYTRNPGPGFNNTLEITAAGDFHLHSTGCFAAAETTGRVSLQGAEVVLESVTKGRREVSRYRLVPWGGRHYLVPAEDLRRFREEIDKGSEPRGGPQGVFYLRREDWKIPVSGKPDLPAGE
jgi:hypothetical protein